VYDIEAGTQQQNLGPGIAGEFSPDGRWLMWHTGDQFKRQGPQRFYAVDTGEQRSLDLPPAVFWLDSQHVIVADDYSENAPRTVVNIATGDSRPATPADVMAWEGRNDVAGRRLKASSERGPGYQFRTHYQLVDIRSGAIVLTFDAYEAVLAPDGTIFLATVPEADAIQTTPEGLPKSFTTNLFNVDPATRHATFIASATPEYHFLVLSASKEHFFWLERACTGRASTDRSWLYSRRDDRLIDFGEGNFVKARFTPSGLLAVGLWNAERLFDPITRTEVITLPDLGSRVAWSPDYRYAATNHPIPPHYCT
jgi:hypothetical protein